MRGELARILREYEAGRTLEHVLRDASERLDLSGFRMFTAALLCCLPAHLQPCAAAPQHLLQLWRALSLAPFGSHFAAHIHLAQ